METKPFRRCWILEIQVSLLYGDSLGAYVRVLRAGIARNPEPRDGEGGILTGSIIKTVTDVQHEARVKRRA